MVVVIHVSSYLALVYPVTTWKRIYVTLCTFIYSRLNTHHLDCWHVVRSPALPRSLLVPPLGQLDQLPQLVIGVQSLDPSVQLDTTTAFRKILSIGASLRPISFCSTHRTTSVGWMGISDCSTALQIFSCNTFWSVSIMQEGISDCSTTFQIFSCNTFWSASILHVRNPVPALWGTRARQQRSRGSVACFGAVGKSGRTKGQPQPIS